LQVSSDLEPIGALPPPLGAVSHPDRFARDHVRNARGTRVIRHRENVSS
jgi:hypothetical protein